MLNSYRGSAQKCAIACTVSPATSCPWQQGERCAPGWGPCRELHLPQFKSRLSPEYVCCTFWRWWWRKWVTLLLSRYFVQKMKLRSALRNLWRSLWSLASTWLWLSNDGVAFSHQCRTQFSTKRVTVRAVNSEQFPHLSLNFGESLDG